MGAVQTTAPVKGVQRDVAAAYSEAGFRVIGTAVAGDAARTLGEKAVIDTRTVARLLVDLENDRDRFDGRTVLMIDEAGTLGAAQARELFEVRALFASVPCLRVLNGCVAVLR